MSVFLLIIVGLPILDLAWWRWADLQLRRLPHAGRWRLLLAGFIAGNLAVYVWLLASRLGGVPFAIPTGVLTACYIWHLAVLPATMLVLAGGGLIRALHAGSARIARFLGTPRASAAAPETAAARTDSSRTATASALTRRQVLAAALVAVPPVAMAAGQVRALAQLASLRVRHLEVVLPTLPPMLDGLTIAQVSDVHVGRFTNGPILDAVVDRTNAMCADLILFTGDLIDYSLDDLPAGLDMLHRLAPQQRLFLCEGNHDLFAGREEFERLVRAAGVALLINESAILGIRGQTVQILGLRWGGRGAGQGAVVAEQMDRLLPLVDPEAFTILLAHHPHAFDRAAEAGIPLTLSGHTHGGQLMLSENIGAGPLLFRYWSGLYRKGPAVLAVSNGVGNWFPLRINAPAEILHLTLRAGARTHAKSGKHDLAGRIRATEQTPE